VVSDPPRLATRLLLGGIAGFVATLPMTAAMRALHRRLPQKERYPAPPRELIDSTSDVLGANPSDDTARDVTMAAHFGYGAATGALIGAILPRPTAATGAAAGVAVWGASYLGWIPAVGLLKPATEHPMRRNGMMIAAHLVWGAATALALRELAADRRSLLTDGSDRDVPSTGGPQLP
jgi:uncharacterized membrane protein YagU involved in acid resistance